MFSRVYRLTYIFITHLGFVRLIFLSPTCRSRFIDAVTPPPLPPPLNWPLIFGAAGWRFQRLGHVNVIARASYLFAENSSRRPLNGFALVCTSTLLVRRIKLIL